MSEQPTTEIKNSPNMEIFRPKILDTIDRVRSLRRIGSSLGIKVEVLEIEGEFYQELPRESVSNGESRPLTKAEFQNAMHTVNRGQCRIQINAGSSKKLQDFWSAVHANEAIVAEARLKEAKADKTAKPPQA